MILGGTDGRPRFPGRPGGVGGEGALPIALSFRRRICWTPPSLLRWHLGRGPLIRSSSSEPPRRLSSLWAREGGIRPKGYSLLSARGQTPEKVVHIHPERPEGDRQGMRPIASKPWQPARSAHGNRHDSHLPKARRWEAEARACAGRCRRSRPPRPSGGRVTLKCSLTWDGRWPRTPSSATGREGTSPPGCTASILPGVLGPSSAPTSGGGQGFAYPGTAPPAKIT